MASRSALRYLMTGAAIASLATVAVADSWSGLIVFGGRDFDSGQYISHEAIFADTGDNIGDGRYRAVNNVDSGGRGRIAPDRVAHELGLGTLNPSQPQSYAGVPTPPDGYNYASAFYSSAQILDSITGTATTSTITFLDTDDTVVQVPGRTRKGFLNDDNRRDKAWGALVMVGSAVQDLRRTADIVRGLDGEVSLNGSYIDLSRSSRDYTASLAADNIVTGVQALVGAEAGLVVVVNAYDVGAIPEVGGDSALLAEAESELTSRENEAESSETLARNSETAAAEAALTTAATELARDLIAARYAVMSADLEADLDDLAALSQELAEATALVVSNRNTTIELQENAAENRATAIELALTQQEIDLRPQLEAAIADPTLISGNRTGATGTYNTRLVQQLQGVDGNVVLIDQRALFDAVIADPARFGLDASINQADACLGEATLFPCNTVGASEGELLFASGVELTEAGHRLAADQIAALISAPADLSAIPAIGISAGRGITDVSRDQLSREQTWKAGVYPFVSGVASRTQLSGSDGFRRQDSGHYSGVAGVKYVTGNGIAVGASGSYQQITSPVDGSAVEYDGNGWFGTVFAGVNTGPVFGSVTATYGEIDYGDTARITQIGSARIRNEGDAQGTVKGVTAEAGVRLVSYDVLRAGPIANFSHWRSEVDGYSESGWEATAVRTGDIETRSTRAGLGVFMEAGRLIDGQGSLFRAKVLYGHEFEDATKTASVTPLGGNSVGSFSTQVRGVDEAPLEFGAEIVLGFRGVLTTFGYDGLYGDFSDHRFRIGASMPL